MNIQYSQTAISIKGRTAVEPRASFARISGRVTAGPRGEFANYGQNGRS